LTAVPIAILDPFSGISGDMTIGALLDLGLSVEWLSALPARLGLGDVRVNVRQVRRGGIACKQVDFEIPPQPHGRHIHELHRIVAATDAPEPVKRLAADAFTAIAVAEGEIHGLPPERVHLHEVGAVDAILDVVGAIWGFELLGVSEIYCGSLSLGDGFVTAAHGVLPVPAPATLKLLEGHTVRPGPEGAGELVTPTGAALVRVLSKGPPPSEYIPVRSGFGAGTMDPDGRPNVLRIILAEPARTGAGVEELVVLATDVDDMTAEHVADAIEAMRAAGAVDVFGSSSVMKKGRIGTRIEVLARPADASRLEGELFARTSTLGIRRSMVSRRALARETRTVDVLGHAVRVKVATLPDGGWRAKPEYDDVRGVANATGRSLHEITAIARSATERR
jgi:uncharacterized protein (TIGR00299 family) protein